jgi:hypothetical protein
LRERVLFCLVLDRVYCAHFLAPPVQDPGTRHLWQNLDPQSYEPPRSKGGTRGQEGPASTANPRWLSHTHNQGGRRKELARPCRCGGGDPTHVLPSIFYKAGHSFRLWSIFYKSWSFSSPFLWGFGRDEPRTRSATPPNAVRYRLGLWCCCLITADGGVAEVTAYTAATIATTAAGRSRSQEVHKQFKGGFAPNARFFTAWLGPTLAVGP